MMLPVMNTPFLDFDCIMTFLGFNDAHDILIDMTLKTFMETLTDLIKSETIIVKSLTNITYILLHLLNIRFYTSIRILNWMVQKYVHRFQFSYCQPNA